MTPEEQLALEEHIDSSVCGQTFSERSTFNKKDLLYVITQIKHGKLPVLHSETNTSSKHTVIPLGTLVFTGGKQHARYIKLSYDHDKELVYINFFHENQLVGTDDLKAITLTEILHESDGDVDEAWGLFTNLIQELFVKTTFKAFLIGQIKEEDFFDESSRLFSNVMCNDRDFVESLNELISNLSKIKGELDNGELTADTDECWLRSVRFYEKFAQQIPVWKVVGN